MKTKFAVAALLGAVSMGANALTVTGLTTNTPGTLVNALLGTGITVDNSSITYQGAITGAGQGGTYSGFSLTAASKPTLTLPNGTVLTSGFSNFSTTTNTVNERTTATGSGSNAALTTLASNTVTNDANALGFSFTVAAGVNAVSIQFVFGSDEFPTQSVTDIFGFFVDGVNYAKFSDGSLIRNDPGNSNNATNFQQGYDIEWNGVSSVLTAVGLLDNSLTSHTVSFAIADTSDTRFDSSVFLAGFSAGTSASGTGGIGAVIDTGNGSGNGGGSVPLPGSLALLGLGLVALARRRS